jgi:pyruvate formate lyase activating enzyme
VAAACREVGVRSVAVSAGYVCPEPRAEFFGAMDAANIDLKAFSERFYKQLCSGQLEAVKETLVYLVHETDVWVEITTLLIPGENDGDAAGRARSHAATACTTSTPATSTTRPAAAPTAPVAGRS